MISQLALLFVFIALSASVPHGSYCGGIQVCVVQPILSNPQSVVGLNITVVTLRSFNVEGTVFDSPIKPCLNEPAMFYPGNNTVSLPNIARPGDCVGSYLSQYGVDPTELEITYSPNPDTLTVTIDNGLGTSFVLTQCMKR